MSKITYIWVAEQSEPGLHGKQYAATAAKTAPAAIASTLVCDGITSAESVCGSWAFVGAAQGGFYSNDYGTFIELETPAMGGAPVEIEEVVRLGWYREASATATVAQGE